MRAKMTTDADEITTEALSAVRRAQLLFKEKLSSSTFSEEEAKALANKILATLNEENLNMQALVTISQEFSNHVLGPHKRNIAAIHYNQLSKLAKLTLDQYIIYYGRLEKLNSDFMSEISPSITEKFHEIIMPALTESDLFDQPWSSFGDELL